MDDAAARPGGRDETLPVVLGLAIWVVLLVIALAAHGRLAAHGHGWWIWSAACGVVVGGLGLSQIRRRGRRSVRREGLVDQDRREVGRAGQEGGDGQAP